MQQENLGFHPLAQHMPYKVSKYANQDIYVKEDNLKENFDKLRNILRNNFVNMQFSRIELKRGLGKKKCNNIVDIDNEKNIYFVIFPNGERISFSPSGITASNGATVNGQNARNLYGSTEFASCFAYAVQKNDPTGLFELLQKYTALNNQVNRQHLRKNLYRKENENTYKQVEQNYDMNNFFKNTVEKYNKSREARRFYIHGNTCEVNNYTYDPAQQAAFVSQPVRYNSCAHCQQFQYPEYEYDEQTGAIRNPLIVGRALLFEDDYNRRYAKDVYEKDYHKPIYKRALYFIQDGNYLIPVFSAY